MTYKNPHLFGLLLIFLFLRFSISAQSITIDTSRVNEFISEVYLDVENELGLNKPENIQRFKRVLGRIEILNSKNIPENFKYLSEIPLINTYNKDLSIDEPFDPQKFNPLKYKFDVSSTNKKVYYLVDKTDYIIIIHPE